ncbi:AraC family transcriptional regulator, partial [Parabacteroides sp.]
MARSVESETIPDSLLTEDYIYEYTFSDFNKAVRILELMREQKKLPDYRLDIAEGDLYFNTGKYLRALKYYQRALDSDSVRNNDEDYMDQLHRMISSYDCLHDEGKKAHYIELLLKKSEECGNVVMQSIAQFNMGKMLYYQEDTRRGYEMVNKAIELMKNSDYKYKYDNLRYNYNTLLIMQQRDQLYTEALHTLDLLESIVTESTDLEPSIEGLADKERKTLYAHRTVILSHLGRKQEAEQAYLEWKRIGHAYDKDNYLIIPFLMNEGRYKEVIALYTERENFLREQNDTINYHMLTAKRTLARAYEKMGNYKRAASYFNDLAVLTDSLKVREQKSAAMELATVYETHEKEDKIKEQQQDLRLRDTFLAGGAFFIGLLLVLLWVIWRNHRTMKGKNHSMAMQIDRLLTYQEELEALKEQLKVEKLATEPIDPKSKELDISEENFSKENIDSVFEQISYLVKDKK